MERQSASSRGKCNSHGRKWSLRFRNLYRKPKSCFWEKQGICSFVARWHKTCRFFPPMPGGNFGSYNLGFVCSWNSEQNWGSCQRKPPQRSRGGSKGEAHTVEQSSPENLSLWHHEGESSLQQCLTGPKCRAVWRKEPRYKVQKRGKYSLRCGEVVGALLLEKLLLPSLLISVMFWPSVFLFFLLF